MESADNTTKLSRQPVSLWSILEEDCFYDSLVRDVPAGFIEIASAIRSKSWAIFRTALIKRWRNTKNFLK